ncbi:iron-sulfur cluster assembly accessory protein [Roseospira marina]|uniref:Iron-sulfur cluster assembly accessory protein n=1 Tax=Roseospira marina TaxID=140057 RepID=A0A5M6IFQ0_9PROT|nr:iron-sulfur cluster assembly accessory protein [Roseospira marina]KAA5607073.1 iron-sulfur cluster assembly accessory protein [Roseospira marina]MBB4312735.1 iron-sulfur cluster assembly protein [Roseospira marina]MBB5086492.1 iron-sulfur cluster assembly protein [Roseospira marina]
MTTATVEPASGRAAPPPPISLTDAAAARVHTLIDRAGKPVLGIRIGVKKAGCSGLQYQVDYVEEAGPFEDVVESKGVRVYIDPMAVMYLLGSEMDYEETKMHSGFVFRNPNEKSRCGCGESFSV